MDKRIAHAVTGLSLLAFVVIPAALGKPQMYVVVAPMLAVIGVAASIPQGTWGSLWPALAGRKWHTVAALMALLVGVPMVCLAALQALR